MMKKLLMTAALFATPASLAEARPVSYAGGWTVMQMNDVDTSSLHIHYSPTAKTSIGYLYEQMGDGDERSFHMLQVNHLLRRWNMPDAQGNVYLKTALGLGENDGHTAAAEFVGIAADFETRRYFTSYEARGTYSHGIEEGFRQSARVGIAPYIGGYNDLQTWLMLEATHRPDARDPLVFTPLVRLFKGPALLEAGYSTNHNILFNWVYRF